MKKRGFSAAVLLAVMTTGASLTTATSTSAASQGCGGASWYALSSRTASGERMNASLLTAAHRSLKFGTRIQVINKRNGRSVVVRVNDRGPFVRGRVVDLSRAAANHIGMISSGTASVCYKTIS